MITFVKRLIEAVHIVLVSRGVHSGYSGAAEYYKPQRYMLLNTFLYFIPYFCSHVVPINLSVTYSPSVYLHDCEVAYTLCAGCISCRMCFLVILSHCSSPLVLPHPSLWDCPRLTLLLLTVLQAGHNRYTLILSNALAHISLSTRCPVHKVTL